MSGPRRASSSSSNGSLLRVATEEGAKRQELARLATANDTAEKKRGPGPVHEAAQRIREVESGGCHSAGRVIAVSGVLSGEVQKP